MKVNARRMKWLAVALVTMTTGAAPAAPEAPVDLESQLEALTVPENQLPALASREKLYAVQDRFAGLKWRHELALGGSRSFTPENYLVSYQASAAYRFYLSNRWYLGLSGSYVFNSRSDAADKLIMEEGIYPDVVYLKWMADVSAGFNVFYGKFRLSMDKVLYFDQYVALGAGLVDTNRGRSAAPVADIGFAFWLGRSGTVRLGLKDYFHAENHRSGTRWTHELLGHLDVGLLLGKGE